MAAKNINLLGEERVLSPDVQRARKTLKTGTSIFMVIFFLVVSAIFVMSLYISNQLEATSRAVTSERARIKALEKNEGAYVLLKQKAVSLVQIMSNRYPFIPLIEFMRQLTGEEAAIHALRLRESGETEVVVSVANSQVLDRFINELLDESANRFTRIELRTLHSTNDGRYDATLSLFAKRTENVTLPAEVP